MTFSVVELAASVVRLGHLVVVVVVGVERVSDGLSAAAAAAHDKYHDAHEHQERAESDQHDLPCFQSTVS